MTRIHPLPVAASLASLFSLSACASVPDLGPARSPLAVESIAAGQSIPRSEEAWPTDAWWESYGDHQLSRLMAEALAASPDLDAAAARVLIAEGYAQQAGAALLPSVEATSAAGYARQSQNYGAPAAVVPDGWQQSARAAIGFGFELDLWGKNRAALAAAKSDLEAAGYSYAQARLALTTAIASTYAELARLHAQRDVLSATLSNRSQTLDLVTEREAAGLDNRAALAQARSRVPAAKAELAATEEAIALTSNAIAALVGAGPDRALAITPPTVRLGQSRDVPVDATIDLIGRRPDIAAARATAEAAASRIKVARAAFYPNVSISGLIGLQALGFGNFFNSGSVYGNAGPAVTLPIFEGGALSGQYRAARGQYDEAVAHYDATLIGALREVSDALVSRNMLAVRLDQAHQALESADEAYALARRRYQAGLSTYLDVLSAEEGVLQARRVLADLETRAFTLDVSMVRALGGGFATT
jgi:NodT family efflux transporter outer membrane factor (OMF) lipoprotein